MFFIINKYSTWWIVGDKYCCSSVVMTCGRPVFDDAWRLSFPNSRRFLLAVRINDVEGVNLVVLVDRPRCSIIFEFETKGRLSIVDWCEFEFNLKK